jgi:hypothetical protein
MDEGNGLSAFNYECKPYKTIVILHLKSQPQRSNFNPENQDIEKRQNCENYAK